MTTDNNEVIGSLKCIDIANTNILPNVNELYAHQHRTANVSYYYTLREFPIQNFHRRMTDIL